MPKMKFSGPLIPTGTSPSRKKSSPKKRVLNLLPVAASTLVLVIGFFSLPTILAIDLAIQDSVRPPQPKFTVTVDPANKTIIENPQVEAILDVKPTSLTAAATQAGNIFTQVAVAISNFPAYRQVAGANTLFVTIKPGFRKEQVANLVGGTLHWTPAEKAEFLKYATARDEELPEGQFVPGTYFLSVTDPDQVEVLLHHRFEEDILARYSSSTEEQVPVADAITVASLIEREAGGWDDMRLISGIIWNRMFVGMNLQIDATLQYAKANQTTGKQGTWWPPVVPKDKYIKSPYNTYQNKGLPPGPISNPSVAAVVAALNPKKTDCLFYFHDSKGEFHCSKTYEEHVKMLKKFYGQGK
ncbi:MAG: protein YceG like [Parcubacteria bacterium C7867-008]|nr:MAG: protein YceG like [Parcubacteria bacterium C7867-008]